MASGILEPDMPLLIVESPTKAKTIQKFLGRSYAVLSSFGHIRDLPERKIGVDVKNGFAPEYTVSAEKKEKVQELKKAAKAADEVYLATDEDREGEAIAWHIAEVLNINPTIAKRITFHEITKPAIEKALHHARTIDMHLVDAQQTRRILDRLVGYELSPLLWKKVQRGLSAGRVQSVAVRLIVERERERKAFLQQEYWSINADFLVQQAKLESKLTHADGVKLEKLTITNQEQANTLAERARAATFTVTALEEKNVSKKPPTPLTTSLLQQDASNRLGFSAKQTMTLAQKLYETGKITYMRTDSQNVADEFLQNAQAYIHATFGAAYATGAVRYKTKKQGAQEAHEAIRPTDITAHPDTLRTALEPGAWKLYNLIWRRTVASQLPPARVERTSIDMSGDNLTFRATGAIVTFDGFLKVWSATDETILPKLGTGTKVGTPTVVSPNQHFTEPPARYSDATLVKAMEEYGIGRPSTYAPTIATIEARNYVLRDDNKKLYPSDIAFVVIDLLKEHFPEIVDYEFTATMEKTLDDIAEGAHDWQRALASFYTPFHEKIEQKNSELTRESAGMERELGVHPELQLPIVGKLGRFGPYVMCGEKKASLKKTQTLDTLTLNDAVDLLSLPRTLGLHPNGEEIIAAEGRFGPYLKCGASNISLPPEHSPHTITLEQAIHLCTEGAAAKAKSLMPLQDFGNGVVVKDGRYGPYVTNGTVNATIPKTEDPKTISKERAEELLQKKQASGGKGRRFGAKKKPRTK